MNATVCDIPEVAASPGQLSRDAQRRILSRSGEPLFLANWDRALMIHFELDARELQKHVPFELDLFRGRAFLSLVAFTMSHMRPRIGGKLAACLFKPIATHEFLNVRTYVRHDGEPGIHFLAEWLSSGLAVQLGPSTFALPYNHGRIRYEHDWNRGFLKGTVTDVRTDSSLRYTARPADNRTFAPCPTGCLDEWLMERYTAFNKTSRLSRFFRIWHPPWPQTRVQAQIEDDSLLTEKWPWMEKATMIGANYSPGLKNVWMGRPHRLTSPA